MIKIASLFSGIGGFEQGFLKSRISHKVVFSSEIDSHAQLSYKANFPNTQLFGDITKIDANSIPDHDILCAGFPCQTFSIAGKRLGFEDTRGTLFFDVARILKAKKPKAFVLENVKNLINHDAGKTFQTILDVLNELGYTIDFSIINSNECGIPQNRERIYIVGIMSYPSESYIQDKRNIKVSYIKNKLNYSKFPSMNFFNEIDFGNKKQRYLKDIVIDQVDERFFFDDQKVVQYINSTNIQEPKRGVKKICKLLDMPREVFNDLDRQRRVYSIMGLSPTVLARSDTTKILIKNNEKYRVRKITPEENFYLQGFDKAFVQNIKKAKISEGQMYKQSGNAVCPQVIEKIFSLLVQKVKK